MKAIGVIPARWASTRLPGKVLIDIAGKPLVQHVWERAQACRSLNEIIIACDEPHVLERCKAFGAKAVMTKKDHPSGSDRVAEVVKNFHGGIVVNIQSDEPLLEADLIDGLVTALKEDIESVVATPVKRISSEAEFLNPNVVKVVMDKNGHALYFSRAPIPFRRDRADVRTWDVGRTDVDVLTSGGYFKHLGLYAYRNEFLSSYCRWPKSFLEEEEKLEQLRILEAGFRIKCVETSVETIGVDTPEDVERVIKILRADVSK